MDVQDRPLIRDLHGGCFRWCKGNLTIRESIQDKNINMRQLSLD